MKKNLFFNIIFMFFLTNVSLFSMENNGRPCKHINLQENMYRPHVSYSNLVYPYSKIIIARQIEETNEYQEVDRSSLDKKDFEYFKKEHYRYVSDYIPKTPSNNLDYSIGLLLIGPKINHLATIKVYPQES